ncbi:MAG: preprotein translocase subunit YajC [Deltaproteobacteria bacterium ADurb.BinA179]|jgi:preprotein translocase subunit YajC|nr:preprotein translocase subunit YajC [Deltaproteobacteria bacterium]MDI9543802.1 preprotein translocase subunit YajC [Pseudomonadota bacterium]NLW68582.1 preprotein translocase subunit YajC [Bacteriovoracaceae bacterium]OPZ25721.1 MAG: preprotein translocase subunit YajC [Deltaproteobacteria bacterium ADurb.BinA179]HRR22576.1 preprotein translocase subunit YajC [Desulfomonilia bacterium]
MISVAYAAGGAGGDTMGIFMSLAPLILIFVVFYFLLIMPQQKKAKQHRQMLESITRGDEVITSGGIHGKVVGIADQVLTLEVGEKMKIKVSREFIAQKKGTEQPQTKK